MLLRFREGRVAIRVGIEAMFYQVQVFEEHRSFLRFLWWKDNNTSNDIMDYEMNAHVFDETSSISCSNYALRRTAIENDDKFGEEVAVTLEKNFYDDDLLKSVNTVKDATSIFNNLIAMCAAAGFNLAKFASNKKEVLLSIPDEKRKKWVKKYLSSERIPQERALGKFCQVEEDTFGVQMLLPK